METNVGDKKDEIRVNNLTIINFVLKTIGPTHERTLTLYMLGIQVRLFSGCVLDRQCAAGDTGTLV